MTSAELRSKFIDFFQAKGHKVLPSASLVPENDPSVLFTTAGMQQFKRYYLFPEEAPAARVATIQKCLRTGDIDKVGDESHLTFFEMLGNFSFGYPKKEESYFKEDAIEFAWELLTEELKISKDRISAAYFKGEDDIPADDESLKIIKDVTGFSDDKIKGSGKDETFWSLGTEGSPGGPTVEFYVDDLEVWNLVFNQYVMQNGKYIESELKGVDTGMGVDRLAMAMQNKTDAFETDLFALIIAEIEKISGKKYTHSHHSEHIRQTQCKLCEESLDKFETGLRDPSAMPKDDSKAFRIIADHLRAAVALISDSVLPSNKDQGYISRRLIRRAIVKGKQIGIEENFCSKIADVISTSHSVISTSPSVISTEAEKSIEKISRQARDDTRNELEREEEKFRKTLKNGLKFIESKKDWTPEELFNLYQTYGIPLEIALEEIRRVWGGAHYKKFIKDEIKVGDDFQVELKKHQDLSRTASAGKFKGGLADNKIETTRLHTAAHLLLAALRQVLSPDVNQKGSNITEERLRFDFNWPEKLTEDQIAQVEKIVNEKIKEDIPVEMEELSIAEAKASGATGVFDDRYGPKGAPFGGEKVKVYTIGNFSREICGGPHIKNTSELGHFKIAKEESSSAGVRRIKAILE